MEAVAFAVIAYGYVAAAVCVLLGPIFIPFFIVPKIDLLFWGWLKAFIGFSFYQVVAAAFIFVFSKVLLAMLGVIGPITLVQCLHHTAGAARNAGVCIYGLVKIPGTHHVHSQWPRRDMGPPVGRLTMPDKETLPVTDAGQKFLELYAEPVVTNTYLKVTILVLSVVALALLALLYRAQAAASRLKPLVISISDIGPRPSDELRRLRQSPHGAGQ